jgi:nitronate monooxygenase
MELFGLKFPIFEAPHGPATCPELAIAVSNAGAMGALADLRSPEEARNAVTKVRSGTKGYFVVNFILQLQTDLTSLQAALDSGAPIVQFSWGVPTREMVSAIRAAKAKLGMQITSVESARVALDLGADYLVCQGTEAGGHVQATRGIVRGVANCAGGSEAEARGCCRWNCQWRRDPQSTIGWCLSGRPRHPFCGNG